MTAMAGRLVPRASLVSVDSLWCWLLPAGPGWAGDTSGRPSYRRALAGAPPTAGCPDLAEGTAVPPETTCQGPTSASARPIQSELDFQLILKKHGQSSKEWVD